MTAILVILIFLALLAGGAYGFWKSCQLMFRGFNRILAPEPTFQAAVPSSKTVPEPTRPGGHAWVRGTVRHPGWVLAIVRHHLEHCAVCREAVMEYTEPGETLAEMLARMEPETITRMLHIVETEDKAVTP
jgi:hypothetical protein